MSKGLGRAQVLMLRAMMSLEAEIPRSDPYSAKKTGGRFYVWAIVQRAWQLSPELRLRQAEEDEARRQWIEARDVDIRARADAGCKLAREFLLLTRSLRSYARRAHRPRQRRDFPNFIEEHLNPSRALASLARRGLIHRSAARGGGSAGLTEAGREAGRRELMRRLSVGTSLSVSPAGERNAA